MKNLPDRGCLAYPAYGRSRCPSVRSATPELFASELTTASPAHRVVVSCSCSGLPRPAKPTPGPRHGYNPDMLKVLSQPTLRSPVLLCALSGWPDAGQAASGALEYLIMQGAPRRFADVDSSQAYV